MTHEQKHVNVAKIILEEEWASGIPLSILWLLWRTTGRTERKTQIRHIHHVTCQPISSILKMWPVFKPFRNSVKSFMSSFITTDVVSLRKNMHAPSCWSGSLSGSERMLTYSLHTRGTPGRAAATHLDLHIICSMQISAALFHVMDWGLLWSTLN